MDVLSFTPMTFCATKVTLAAGTTTTISTTGTTTYAIRGKYYSKAALSNAATPTTDAITGSAFNGVVANKGSVFVVGYNAAGSVLAAQGSITDLDTSGNFKQAPQLPSGLPLDFCPIGYLVIKAGSTANATTGWIFGTSNMSSVTGITYTFGDLATLTDRPLIS
jgi:hypothetical protein